MTVTIVGVVADRLGYGGHRTYGLDERGGAWRHDEHWATPSSAYRVASDHLLVDWRHDKVIGQVAHLELQAGNLWAIGEVDTERLAGIADELGAADIYWSPETWQTRSHWGVDAELMSLGLTPTPGSNALPAVKVLAGDLDYAAQHTPRPLAARLTRAVDTRRRRGRGEPIRIVDVDPPRGAAVPRRTHPDHLDVASRSHIAQWVDEYDRPLPMTDDDRRPAGREIEIRPGGRILSVR